MSKSLDFQNLVSVIELANGSERGSSQKLAENQLKEWEIQPGFHYLLQSIYNDLSLPLQIRWLAIINFKNGIERYWRQSKKNSISKDEKSQIRSRLFELIDEPNKQLSIQNAQAISRISRLDFPNDWSSLFDDFGKILQDSILHENNVKIYNILLILNQVIKNLSSAKIGRIRPSLQSKIPTITPLLIQIYIKYSNEWIKDWDFEFSVMEIGYLSLKVLRRTIVDIYDIIIDSNEIVEFLSISIQHFQILISNYNNNNVKSNDLFIKYIKCFSKIYYLLIKSNLTNFIQLKFSKEILYTLLKILQEKAQIISQKSIDNDDDEEEIDLWEFLSIKTLLIFKNLISFIFKPSNTLILKSKLDKSGIENSINFLKFEFFTETLIKNLIDLLINYYIKLRPIDLESWINEPEEWSNEEINENYEFQIRQCSENFFQDLILNFKPLLIPYILNKIENELQNYNESNINNILIKDSIFTIIQLSAHSIYETIEFNEIFPNFFLPEGCKNDLIEYKILKRRLSLLIKEWYSLNLINEDNMNKIYSMFLTFLDPTNEINDKVVKLTTLQTINSIILDYELNKQIIEPYISKFIPNILQLIDGMELVETKNFLLKILSNFISINKLNELELLKLLEIIPKYWDLSNNNNELILKTSLLRILKNINNSLMDSSFKTFQISLPLIEISCHEKSEFFSILSEDGFELWLTILQNYPIDKPLDPSLLNNFNNLFIDALLNQTEILPLILQILQSYSLLIPEMFILNQEDNNSQIIFKIFKILSNYINSMRDDSYEILLSILENLIIFNYKDSNQFIQFFKLLIDSNFLKSFIELTLKENQSDLIISKNLIIFARLSFGNENFLIEYLKFLYPSSLNNDEILINFLNIWYIKLDNNISNPRNRKINLFGLLKFLSIGILNNLKILLNLLILNFEEINELNINLSNYYQDYNFQFQYNEDFTIKKNGEYKRFFQNLSKFDPILKFNLKQFTKQCLQQLNDKYNLTNKDELIQILIENSDQTTVENFQYALNMN
ncbi:hypothetical protein WICMUC_004050 [Wickerhamomyces mucosus]|uniref:Importin N-terminal domain-containing protein n=1 Tax=Wickerhamomyces mucosus TaxID=1378264 RepID=A0A9P8TAW2_9ASCO|nr:hypothetical protein WICMUC_004050 [Wickerhamomyces mucosus]